MPEARDAREENPGDGQRAGGSGVVNQDLADYGELTTFAEWKGAMPAFVNITLKRHVNNHTGVT